MQLSIRILGTAVICLGAAVSTTYATPIDLGVPGGSPFLATGAGDSRSVVLRDDSTLALTSLGIFMDPLVSNFNLTGELYSYDLTTNTRGALLATNTTAFTDQGLMFYDVPLIGSLVAGNSYELNLKPFGLGNFNLQFYDFNNPSGSGPDSPYAAGPVTVIDGAGDGNVGGRANTVLAHFELDGTQDVTPVPEPTSLLLMGTGLGMYWRKRSSAKS